LVITLKGVMFKYDADPRDTLMRDNQADCGADICGMMDPDFWTNTVPIWSICGPYVRQNLSNGDVLFYLPKKASIDQTNLSDYICTGVLVVGEILPNSQSVIEDPDLTNDYKEAYLIDLENHLRQDKPRTKRIRGYKIIKGAPDRSRWFGKNRLYLRDLLSGMNYEYLSNSLDYQRVPYLDHSQALTLYNKLVQLNSNVQV